MRRGTGLLLVAAAAVLLAGCGASVTGGDRQRGSTPTLTPVPVPAETGPAGGRLLAPGLSTEGVFDADELASAHRTALDERGFTVVRNRTLSRPNASAGSGTLNGVGVRATVEPGATAYRFGRAERSGRSWPLAGRYALLDVWYSDPVVRYRYLSAGRVDRYWGQDAPRRAGRSGTRASP